jgi:hypothetical protein
MEAFDSWARVGSFAVGFLGVVAFFQSILRVALLHVGKETGWQPRSEKSQPA